MFTTLACQLNEWEENTAPTDTRRRPDQRLMEVGEWDDSNLQKLRYNGRGDVKWVENGFNLFVFAGWRRRSGHVAGRGRQRLSRRLPKDDPIRHTSRCGSPRYKRRAATTCSTFIRISIGRRRANRTGPSAQRYSSEIRLLCHDGYRLVVENVAFCLFCKNNNQTNQPSWKDITLDRDYCTVCYRQVEWIGLGAA